MSLTTANSIFCDPVFRNWLGRLRLRFKLNHDGRSILVERCHYGPFYVQKPFYYEGEIPHVYLLHPPGGLVGGDRLDLFVNLEKGSQVLLTFPGSTKFYRSNGSYVYVRQRFNLERNSTLEWLPQSNIFFSHSKVISDTIFTMAKDSRCIFFEIFCFGRLSLKERFTKGTLNIFLSIVLKNSYGLKERIRIDCSDDPIFDKFGGYRVGASFFAIPGDVQILNDVRVFVKKFTIEVIGATLLGNLLIVRMLSNSDERIRLLLRSLWSFLRPVVIGKKAVIPRIWLT